MGMTNKIKHKKSKQAYPRFQKINGKHPFQQNCPESFVPYMARKRKGGKVAYFNFDLAKEMGLIPKKDDCVLNKELEKQIIDTFSLVIINEYDIINDVQVPEKDIKPHPYMATKYLQLQHPNKQGKTSGDGRSIWNGRISHGNKTWDISSCGTGATRLSPATHLQNKYFQTGDPSISYGCGYSEIDEGLCTLFFSEILHRNGYNTERVLAIIEFEKGISINVRAHSNLLRPSHMFNHLKQGNLEELERVVNYYIDDRESAGEWDKVPKTKAARYKYFLNKQIEVFANLAADFEDDYIFCWLDWDGDNILMDGGVIDYGSIRQFGLFHHEYRYDDVERYSTTIKEQKDKAKHIAKTFVQIVDYLIKGDKRPLSKMSNSKFVKDFDKIFDLRKKRNLLTKIGFDQEQVEYLLKKHNRLIEVFKKSFSYFERAKSHYGLHEVADGINWDAIFCMRDILRELPQLILHRGEKISHGEFIEVIKSSYAVEEDLELTNYRKRHINDFQNTYIKLVKKIARYEGRDFNEVLLKITMRSSIINKYDRITGDSITKVVDKVLNSKPKFSPDEIFKLSHEFAEYQNLDPDTKIKKKSERQKKQSKMMKGILQIVRDYREGI